MKVYQIKAWQVFFEGSKSITYNNKTSCQMPTKQGLGFRKIISQTNGAALFGAWCVIIQLLSKHQKPRNGFLTVDGTKNGKPYTPEDLELLTGIKAKMFSSLFKIASDPNIDWLIAYDAEDTTGDCEDTIGDPQGTIVPLDLDLDLDSNSDSNPKIIDKKKFEYWNESEKKVEYLKIRINKIYRRKETTLWNEKEIKKLKDVAKRPDTIAELTEIETLYLSLGWKKFKRRDVQTFLNNWTTELDRARNPNNYEVDNDRPKTQGELALAEYKRQRDGQK